MRKFITNHLIIFALIVTCISVARQIYYPNIPIKLTDIYVYMICSFMVNLLSLIFYSKKEISEKEMWIRRITHFISLEIVLLVFAYSIGFVESIKDIFLLEIQIAVVYVIDHYLVWMYDRKTADKINDKLNDFKEKLKFEGEE